MCSAAIILAGTCVYNLPSAPTAKAAIIETMKQEDEPFSKQKHQMVQVPNSPYTLVIFDVPHKIWLLKSTEFLGRYKASIDMAFNVYESTFKKDSDCYENNKLVYGLTTIPEGKEAFVKDQRVNTFPLESYFKSSKYASVYKNLYFYYLDKPVNIQTPSWAITFK